MDVINDLTSSLSSDLNSTELAKDLGPWASLPNPQPSMVPINLGIKLLEILFTALSLLAHDSHFQ